MPFQTGDNVLLKMYHGDMDYIIKCRGRARARGRGRVEGNGAPVKNAHVNENPHAHHEEIEEKNVDVKDVDDVGQEEEGLVGPGVLSSAKSTQAPTNPPVASTAPKGLVGPGVLSSAKSTQAPTNPHVASTAPKVGGTGGNDAFFCPLLGFVMNDKYVPRTWRDHKKDEFMALEKDGMIMVAYEANFHDLSRYATQLVTTEEERFGYLLGD
ncbi:hypothetical protein MTR67_018699 [Solanum verrucosum]|uniref:Uncharacterized protein n=1 Tax=Solanum verrucosum TaxID=315347 RepID=A0AAF0TMX3_SOLVR|nr:hypothetical protein MTR67_018699 [Solanum verrucosum]